MISTSLLFTNGRQSVKLGLKPKFGLSTKSDLFYQVTHCLQDFSLLRVRQAFSLTICEKLCTLYTINLDVNHGINRNNTISNDFLTVRVLVARPVTTLKTQRTA